MWAADEKQFDATRCLTENGANIHLRDEVIRFCCSVILVFVLYMFDIKEADKISVSIDVPVTKFNLYSFDPVSLRNTMSLSTGRHRLVA